MKETRKQSTVQCPSGSQTMSSLPGGGSPSRPPGRGGGHQVGSPWGCEAHWAFPCPSTALCPTAQPARPPSAQGFPFNRNSRMCPLLNESFQQQLKRRESRTTVTPGPLHQHSPQQGVSLRGRRRPSRYTQSQTKAGGAWAEWPQSHELGTECLEHSVTDQ